MTEAFTPAMLNDSDRFKAYFDPEESLKQIANLPKEAVLRPKGELYYGKMQVVWIIVTAPFTAIFSVFLHAIAHTIGMFSNLSLSRSLHITASNMRQSLESFFAQVQYGKRFLLPACNRHRVEDSAIYRHPSMNRSEILAPDVQAVVMREKIDFFLPLGLCRGAIIWFNYLFDQVCQDEELNKQYPTLESKLLAIGHLFKEGVPSQGALLHVLKADERSLLNYHFEKEVSFTPEQITQSSGEIIDRLKELEDGAHSIFFSAHGISFIKEGTEQFIWDPTAGLIRITNTIELLDELQSKGDKEILIAKRKSGEGTGLRISG